VQVDSVLVLEAAVVVVLVVPALVLPLAEREAAL